MYSDYFLFVILCKILLNKPLINIAGICTDFQIYKVRKHDFLYDLILQLTGLERKEEKIIKHGFRLLEEQLGLHIKEKYSGISKIEFSPER